jgi:hypothetical protein
VALNDVTDVRDGLTNPWEPWQRLIDSIGPHYRTQLLAARDRAKGELGDLDDEQLETLAAEGRRAAGTLDEDGARLTVTMTENRERHSGRAADLQREAELLLGRHRWAMTPRRRRQARADAAERADRAEEHRRRAAQAHERLRELGNSGRHLCPWFGRHQDVLARGMAAELTLDAAHQAVYHVLGAPGIASLTAACLTSDRAIDLGQLQELVRNGGEAPAAAAVQGRSRAVRPRARGIAQRAARRAGGEDLDRVLYAIAVVKRRRIGIPGTPDDLWIRAAEPEYTRSRTGASSGSCRRPLDTRCRTRIGAWPRTRSLPRSEPAVMLAPIAADG